MGPKYKWGIRRETRPFIKTSYQGPLWKKLGVVDPPERFDTKRDAESWAIRLSEVSRTGYYVPFPLNKKE